MRWRSKLGVLRAATLCAVLAIAASTSASSANAPGFALPTRDGKTLSLDSLKGQVVMLNFWASWCGPCRQEMPLLDQLYKKYSSLGFTLVGVNVEADSKAAEQILAQAPVSFPVLFDRENKVSKQYDVSAMPSSVFIDRKGNIRTLHKGYKPGDEAAYTSQIRALLRE